PAARLGSSRRCPRLPVGPVCGRDAHELDLGWTRALRRSQVTGDVSPARRAGREPLQPVLERERDGLAARLRELAAGPLERLVGLGRNRDRDLGVTAHIAIIPQYVPPAGRTTATWIATTRRSRHALDALAHADARLPAEQRRGAVALVAQPRHRRLQEIDRDRALAAERAERILAE